MKDRGTGDNISEYGSTPRNDGGAVQPRGPVTRWVVGVSDMKICHHRGGILVTHALGSCVGIVLFDPEIGVGGMLHYMLPLSRLDQEKARKSPLMFGDTGIPMLFHESYKFGAVKERLRVIVAGGAQVFEQRDFFDIGARNITIARKMLWKNNVMIAAEHVGGHQPRTLYLDTATGETWLTTRGIRIDL